MFPFAKNHSLTIESHGIFQTYTTSESDFHSIYTICYAKNYFSASVANLWF